MSLFASAVCAGNGNLDVDATGAIDAAVLHHVHVAADDDDSGGDDPNNQWTHVRKNSVRDRIPPACVLRAVLEMLMSTAPQAAPGSRGGGDGSRIGVFPMPSTSAFIVISSNDLKHAWNAVRPVARCLSASASLRTPLLRLAGVPACSCLPTRRSARRRSTGSENIPCSKPKRGTRSHRSVVCSATL